MCRGAHNIWWVSGGTQLCAARQKLLSMKKKAKKGECEETHREGRQRMP